MADENNAPNLVAERVIDNPSSSQQNIGNETLDDVQSVASSANSLQMSMLENKLESEMIKMSRMVKDTISGLTEQMNQKLNEVDTKFNNLLADLVPTGQNSNVNSSVAHPIRHNPDSVEPPIVCSTQPKGDHTQCKMKPQNFNGTTDFDEFLSQFEITCEINGWQYREKSLYLASCL